MIGCLEEGSATAKAIPDTSKDQQQPVAQTTSETSEESSKPEKRAFRFNYDFALTGLQPGATAKIWVPLPPSNSEQSIKLLESKNPGEVSRHTDARYQNEMLQITAEVPENGILDFSFPYEVVRQEVKGLESDQVGQLKLKNSLFLGANSKVPVDGKPLELIADQQLVSDKLDRGRQLYNIVEDHVKYSKDGEGWGQGDSVWVCDSQFGNCTDFHSLFISLARSQKMPARFEIGFPLPSDKTEGTIGGYHCWAWFSPDEKRWIPVDISEADKHPEMKEYYFGSLTADRVLFTVGRDIELVPKPADAGPLNFFIYPHAEVEGKSTSPDQLQKKFSFEDISG